MAGDARPLRFTTPDGLSLTGFLREAREPARPPALLFMPGNGLPVQAYRPLLAALPEDATIHALNHRGHGGSEVPAALDDWAVLVADARAYVDARMTPPVILAGHSLGAAVALRLAAESPALAAGLLLLEPVVRARRGTELPPEARAATGQFIEHTRARRDSWASREEAAAWFAGSVGYRLWHDEARAEFIAHGLAETAAGSLRLATPPWLEAAIYTMEPRDDFFACAESARCPGVLLRGQESAVVDRAALEELAALLPLAVLLPAPGTHVFPLEQPAEAATLLEKGLRLLRGETGLATG